MENFLLIIGGVATLVLIALIMPLIYLFGGFLTGWVLANVFPWAGEYLVTGLRFLHIEVTLSQLPMFTAILGFIGAFFKASVSTHKHK
jgi:hypothetical protein